MVFVVDSDANVSLYSTSLKILLQERPVQSTQASHLRYEDIATARGSDLPRPLPHLNLGFDRFELIGD